MTDKKCPQCGGPANHPVGSSACKRIGIQRTDKDKEFEDEPDLARELMLAAIEKAGYDRGHKIGWDAYAERVEDMIEAALSVADLYESQSYTKKSMNNALEVLASEVDAHKERPREHDGKGKR